MRASQFGELNAFVAVAAHRNFTRAAAQLGLSPPTLSHTVRALETRLGVRLFNRTTRSVALTPAGEGLLAQLEPLLEGLDTAMEEGANVPPFYDSMIAKLIVHAPDRSKSVERLRAALESFVVEGISTNIPFLRSIAAHPDFISNRVDTRWLESVFLPQYGQPKDA